MKFRKKKRRGGYYSVYKALVENTDYRKIVNLFSLCFTLKKSDLEKCSINLSSNTFKDKIVSIFYSNDFCPQCKKPAIKHNLKNN